MERDNTKKITAAAHAGGGSFSAFINQREGTIIMHYVIADIHGDLRRLNSVLEQIDLRPEDTLYVLGDVIDRHPYGIRMLQTFMGMENVKMILGNHEHMMMNAIGVPGEPETEWHEELLHWYRNGGEVTHQALNRLDVPTRREIFAYLKALPLNLDVMVNGEPYKLVHGGPLEDFERNRERYRNDETFFAVWKRYKPDEFVPQGYTMVFGHTPTDEYLSDKILRIWHGDHMIGIDCGSGYPDDCAEENGVYGRLACLRLDDGKEYYSEENWDSEE